MNRIILILMLMLSTVASCNQTTPAVNMIEPGDRIGEMIVNTTQKNEKLNGG